MSEDRFDRETGEIIEHAPLPAVGGEMRPLASRDTGEVMTAMAKAQAAMEVPKRTKTATVNPRDQSRRGYTYSYAPLEEINRVIKQPFADNGLCKQEYIVSRSGTWFVRTIVWHTSGQWISGDFPVFADNTAHSFAGGVTTARRLGTSMLCGLAPEDDDDNASQAEAKPAAVSNGGAQPVATRANPAVAPNNPASDDQRRIARQIKYALDAAKSPEDLREIYDPILEEWGGEYQDDAALLNTVTLNFLRSHVRSRMQQIGEG